MNDKIKDLEKSEAILVGKITEIRSDRNDLKLKLRSTSEILIKSKKEIKEVRAKLVDEKEKQAKIDAEILKKENEKKIADAQKKDAEARKKAESEKDKK